MFNIFKKTVDEVVKESRIATKVIKDVETAVDSVVFVEREMKNLSQKVSVLYDNHVDNPKEVISLFQMVHFLCTLVVAGILIYEHLPK